MSKEHALPSGATVTLRDPLDLRQKDRDKIYPFLGDNKTVADAVNLGKILIGLMVESWTFDLLPPSVKLESLGELSIADYDKLSDLCEPALTALFPKLAPAENGVEDPKAITPNSAD